MYSTDPTVNSFFKVLDANPDFANALKDYLNDKDSTSSETVPINSRIYTFCDAIEDVERYINRLKEIDFRFTKSLYYEYSFTIIAKELKYQPVLSNLFTGPRPSIIKGTQWEIRNYWSQEDNQFCYNSCEQMLKSWLIHNVICKVYEDGTGFRELTHKSIPEIVQDVKNSQAPETALAIAINLVSNKRMISIFSTLRAQFRYGQNHLCAFEEMVPYFKNPWRVMYIICIILPTIHELQLEEPFIKVIRKHIKEEKDIEIDEMLKAFDIDDLNRILPSKTSKNNDQDYKIWKDISFEKPNRRNKFLPNYTFGMHYKDPSYKSLRKAAKKTRY